jgi:hypothetical protein
VWRWSDSFNEFIQEVQMAKSKKIINDPKNVVPELLEGLTEAYHGQVIMLEGVNALVKADLPEGKVGLLIGGGSGHEPWRPPRPWIKGLVSSTCTATTRATT